MTELSAKLRAAGEELRWLLNRGYPKESALEFVCNHHKLPLKDRNILVRTVYPESLVNELRKRFARPTEVAGKELGIDGYNVIITVESMLSGKPIFLCDDGWIRDVSATFGKHTITPTTRRAIKELMEVLARIQPSWFDFLLDKNVSWSGKLAELIRKEIDAAKLDGSARTVRSVDAELKNYSVVATSDHAIVLKHRKVLDLPALLVEKLGVRLLRV